MGLKSDLLRLFPAPEFRKYQKRTIEMMAELFDSGVKCILLEAPVGSGKSLINTTFARYWRSFYTTPQLTLITQILNDKNLGKYFRDIKGRRNYVCAHDPFATVENGLCKRMKWFKCDKEVECEYFKRKMECREWSTVITSAAYLILEGRWEESESYLGNRELLIVDEGHNIAELVSDYISITLSPYSLPVVYNSIKDLLKEEYTDISDVINLVKLTINKAKRFIDAIQTTLDGGFIISEKDSDAVTKVTRWLTSAEEFINSVDKEWVWDSKITKNYRTLTIKPVYSRDFMEDYIWKRGERIIVSSATILNSKLFVFETGLDKIFKKSEIALLKVPCTFDKENRPIIDTTIGKMTIDEKYKNIGMAVKTIENILRIEKGKVALHCHSYGFANMVYDYIAWDIKPRLIIHDAENRNEKLQEWYKSKDGVFVSVKFEEGQDWKGELCDAQILLKVPYPDSKEDARIARRLERGEWTWYYLQTLKEVIQAYGRAIRSETDKKRFYVVDSSFYQLISRNWTYVPEWFAEVLPKYWNKKEIENKIDELKKVRNSNIMPELKGKSDTELKEIAIEVLKEECKDGHSYQV